MLRTTLFLAVLCLAAVARHPAEAAPICTQKMARAADNALGEMKTWPGVAAWVQRFASCNDAGIAEGSAGQVVNLLSKHWDTLPDLIALLPQHPGLQKFVVYSVSGLDSDADLDAIESQARTACPPGSEALCRALQDQVAGIHADRKRDAERAAFCTDQVEADAEQALATLTDWPALSAWLKRFGLCSDGELARKKDIYTLNLLTRHWNTLPSLAAQVQQDPALKPDVLLTLRATFDEAALRTIIASARKSCPVNEPQLCADIATTANDKLTFIVHGR